MDYSYEQNEGVTALKLSEELGLTVVYSTVNLHRRYIDSKEISRLSLNLISSFANYVSGQPLMIGSTELEFLEKSDVSEQAKLVSVLRGLNVPLIILTQSVSKRFGFLSFIKALDIPVLKVHQCTHKFLARYYSYMEVHLSKGFTIHGELLEVYGAGVLITGDSGVGKSECAVELIKRGHRFIADDAVHLQKIDDGRSLVGSSPKNIQGFLELRGVGIINVRNMFGMSSIKSHQRIDAEVNLYKFGETGEPVNRFAMDTEVIKRYGVIIPRIRIPVSAGRNVAVIIEVAVMNVRNKLMGYDAASLLLNRLKTG